MEMVEYCARADTSSGSIGLGGDLQHLTKRAQHSPSHFDRIIRTRVGDNNYPDRLFPTREAVCRKNTQNTSRNRIGPVSHGYDNPYSLDCRRCYLQSFKRGVFRRTEILHKYLKTVVPKTSSPVLSKLFDYR
jgi:hypothetical protein